MSKAAAVGVLIALLLYASTVCAEPTVAVAAEPDWALPAELPATGAQTVSGGVDYLLYDRQVRVQAATDVLFVRHAMRVTNLTGAEEMSQISIEYSPGYQRLVLHRIEIQRDGQWLDRRDSAQIRELQQESDIDTRVYYGTSTLHAILKDIRPGDTIYYSYSVSGRNPVFDARYYGDFRLQWGVPVAYSRVRLLMPQSRRLQLNRLNTATRMQWHDNAEQVELLWQQHAMPALTEEQDAPSWFSRVPRLQVSEAPDWSAVRAWADGLYGTGGDSPELAGLVDELSAADTAGRLRGALRFVQQNVRYLAIEMSERSYAPAPPDAVLERRYGDCKDKAVLLVTLLRRLGIEAHPALVHTERRHALLDQLPSPLAFNHAIVVARLDGRDYWLDPTLGDQGGDLQRMMQPDYGFALVVDGRATGLQLMPATEPGQRDTEVVERYDFEGGFDSAGRLTVETTHSGRAADTFRYRLQASSVEHIGEEYLEYYRHRNAQIAATAPMEVADDPLLNRIHVTESYSVPQTWATDEQSGEATFEFYPPDIGSRVTLPPGGRQAPLYIGNLISLHAVAEVSLPVEVHVEPESEVVEDAAFHFERHVVPMPSGVRVEYRYRSNSEFVEPQRLAEYRAHAQRVADLVSYRLEHRLPADAGMTRDNGIASLNVIMLALMIISFAGATAVTIRLNRWDPPPMRPQPGERQPSGIGGLLLLPAIGLIVFPMALVAGFSDLMPVFDLTQWNALTDPASEQFIPGFAIMAVLEILTTVLLLLGGLLLLVQFFRCRSSMPRLYIAWTLFALLCAWADYFWAAQLNLQALGEELRGELAKLVRVTFTSLLWSAYFATSRRVRNTFVRRRNPDPVETRSSDAPPTAEQGAAATATIL